MIVKEINIEDILIPQSFIDEEHKPTIDELMISIKEKGLIQPITVCEKDNKYKLITGYHRLTACRRLLLKTISASIDNTSFNTDVDEYIYHRNITLNENRVRKQYTVYQLKKMLDEERELYYLQNPGARENEEKARKEYEDALRKEKEINQILKDAHKSDLAYWNKELDKAKTIIDKTAPPVERLARITGVSSNKIKNLNLLTDLEKKVPNITKMLEQSGIAESRIANISKFLNDNDIIDKFRKIKNKKDLIQLIDTLEAILKGKRIKTSEIVDEGDGIYRIGIKHYISYTDKDYKIRKFDFNTKVNINSIDVAKATIEMLSIEHLRVLVLCETDEIHNFIIKALGISK